ncbi:sialoadhesin-like, partial [Etheostoma cragini]|uniref:sialoadhesin-like n=1 Tax=Etheostoma cragini TaxID=417921 RepID=UPI00155ECBC0
MEVSSSRGDGDVKRGEAVTLSCSAGICTTHQLEVTWFRDGSALSQSGPALHLSDLTAKDSGNYTCGLKGRGPTLSAPYSLHVGGADEEGGGGRLPLIVGLVLGVLLVIIIAAILLVCIIKRKRAAGPHQSGRQDQDLKLSANSSSVLPPAERQGPVAVEDVNYASVQFTHKNPARYW